MSTQHDIIINPKTQRPVKVGSRTWLGLVREGLTESNYQDPMELYKTDDPGENLDEKIKEINQTLPIDQQAVRGRGKYKNKIVKRRLQPTARDLTHHTARTAARAMGKLIDSKELDMSETLQECEDLEAQLENLIMMELLGSDTASRVELKKPPKLLGKVRKKEERYEVNTVFNEQVLSDISEDGDEELYDEGEDEGEDE